MSVLVRNELVGCKRDLCNSAAGNSLACNFTVLPRVRREARLTLASVCACGFLAKIDARAALTAVMTGTAYRTSAELSQQMGPFAGYKDARYWDDQNPPAKDNVDSMLEVIEKHLKALDEIDETVDPEMMAYARSAWRQALQ